MDFIHLLIFKNIILFNIKNLKILINKHINRKKDILYNRNNN